MLVSADRSRNQVLNYEPQAGRPQLRTGFEESGGRKVVDEGKSVNARITVSCLAKRFRFVLWRESLESPLVAWSGSFGLRFTKVTSEALSLYLTRLERA